ncbi:MAG TPA: hypothetical protein VFO36_03380, partial [Nitrospiraceae bacterium]|nr:hypothetical protein [Nitrospiraceae bacterium]
VPLPSGSDAVEDFRLEHRSAVVGKPNRSGRDEIRLPARCPQGALGVERHRGGAGKCSEKASPVDLHNLPKFHTMKRTAAIAGKLLMWLVLALWLALSLLKGSDENTPDE